MLKLTPKEQKLVLLLACLLISGFILRYVLPEKEDLHIARESGAEEMLHPAGGNNLSDDDLEQQAKKIIEVHVTGAVVHSGVYILEEGARVYQAVEKAGGTSDDADLERINLAQPLYDGQQVFVPRKLEEGPSGEENSYPQGGKLNINIATQSQLEALPGIGAVKAQSIIKYRQENGHFSSIEELLKISGIGEHTLEGIRELISVY